MKKVYLWVLVFGAGIIAAAAAFSACSDTAAVGNDGGAGSNDTGLSEDGGGAGADAGAIDAGKADAGAADAGAADAGIPDAAAADAGTDAGPALGQGIGCFLTISVVQMMGQTIGLAAAGFYPETAIVPFDPNEGVKGFAPDTCREGTAAVQECKTDADCVQGQVCLPDYDQSGKPIANTGNCENPTGDPVDIGPMTVDGFSGGPVTLAYNAGQNGAYTPDGQGDGSIDPTTVTPDHDYTISGQGDAAQNLGAFSGTLHVPPFINLTEPVPQQNQMGSLEITLDTTSDLTLKWDGSSNGYVKISIQGNNTSVECLARDDGEFTIPAAAMANLKLFAYSFFNIVNLERTTYGMMAGPGLVNPQVSSIMTIMVNAKPK